MSEFGCSLSEKVIIVTDRGSNMVAAFRNVNHIFCVNHLINNSIEKAIDGITQISDLCHKISKLIKYFKKSGANSDLKTTLKSFSPTRWNTIYYMLSSVENNWSEIIKILQEKGELRRVDGINLHNLNSLTKILQPFEKISNLLEGETYPTMKITYVQICL